MMTGVMMNPGRLLQAEANTVGFGAFRREKKANPLQPHLIRLEKTVRDLSRMNRQLYNLPALNAAADYIKAQWQKMGYTPTEQTFTVDKTTTLRNVMVSFGPENAERLIIGAHYDVFGNTPGADDNASGVAGLLELGRLLKENQPKLKHRVDLLAFSMEEQPFPCSGSAAHAKMLKAQGVPVKGMVSLEMIGYYSDQKGSQSFPAKLMKWIYPDTGNFISVVGYQKGFNLVRQTKRAINQNSDMPARMIYSPINAFGLNRSDHASYIAQGMPAVMVTDTANYRNANYHKPTDTPDTLDYKRMAEVVKGIYALATQ